MIDENLFMSYASQMGIFPSHISFTSLPSISAANVIAAPTLSDRLLMDFGGPQILSLQRSSANHGAWGGVSDCMNMKSDGADDLVTNSTSKRKKIIKGRRNLRDPRFCFKTMSDVDILDDGYKWRKYGQKIVKNTLLPRSYYRCTRDNCSVKKRVERLADDPRMVITTYEGRHVHSPSHHHQD
ncbi:WRKY DNA-binding protein 13 [Perilla frutescens var. frutescens]|nr:WRKY DNA-binding protein 13 [Perilla frutescens var. frutescens]